MKNNVIRGTTTLLTIILTAALGRIQNTDTGMTETWYDLPMSKVVANAQEAGIPCEYWIRDDGVKMFGAKKQGSRNRGTKQRGRADMYEG